MTQRHLAREVLARLRAKGHRGGTIATHRAIWRLSLPRGRLWGSVALALGLSLALWWLRPWVGRFWGMQLLWWMQVLALPGRFDLGGAGVATHELFAVSVPSIELVQAVPDDWAPVWHGAALTMLWWCTSWLPEPAKPIAFFVRLGVLIHAAAVLFFAFWPASFVHSIGSHVISGMRQAWYLILLTPWIHLATFYLFPFAMWQRTLLTVLTAAYLAVLTPLQYALHVALVQAAGLILLPVLHLLFGVMLAIVGFVALYGWGMSWPAPSASGDREAA
ncbi:hypothetical protein RD110_08230 [Rhodoferax koreense]|uniref:Uncharacterized protein n=1 Tax=Rhodoferax koreensis TaxID=1842727 RepID=A0A1P8JTV6_9BURK|nr:hypothetical protein [Rhodoferax koreense]APW37187.1 hypothetical protein RD110_08230 [Rhodoferax koreense]